ncbi:hypothetical protein [Marinobacterium lutimaris]|uniref:Uncharacterized protein n=1 Tax=Marinobacterium lutimaris TaxID=568106 RepID=A0A1H5XMH6_9GAMM|nr:hypothetical protein [Marinobacterium lutimaris]SEG12872.1 hypothetical protein SAMN05444390_1011436 [Marinobacterium lutimaris]
MIDQMTMDGVLMVSSLLTLAFALLALFMGWLSLRLLDRMGGINFKETVGRITYEPKPAAIYFGLRFVGVCVLLGMVLS